MEEKQSLPSPSEEANIDEALQRRIRACQRAEGISRLVCFGIAILALVIIGLLLLTHLMIVRLLLFRLLVSPGPMLLLETLQHWSPWRVTLGYLLGAGTFALVSFPLTYWTGFVLPRWCRLTRRSLSRWLLGWCRLTLFRLADGLVTVQVYYALLIAWPDTWWLWTVLLLATYRASFAYLSPIVFSPLRYRCTTVTDPALIQMLQELITRGGNSPLHFKQLVRRAWRNPSPKLLRPNGYAAGWGKTRTILVTDGLLKHCTLAEIRCVLAHEVGHHMHHDGEKKLVLGLCLLVAEFVSYNLLVHWMLALVREAAAGYHPQIVLTVWLILALGVLTSYSALLIRRFYSRRTEYQTDEFALQITSDVSAFKSAKIRMMNLGKSPLDVSPLHLLERTHPSFRQRLAHADEFANRMRVASLDHASISRINP
jgi:STE24 endopeptidase